MLTTVLKYKTFLYVIKVPLKYLKFLLWKGTGAQIMMFTTRLGERWEWETSVIAIRNGNFRRGSPS